MASRVSRIKPSIYECLSPYADAHYVALFEGFVSGIVELAKQQHTQVVDYPLVLKVFKLNRETDLAMLAAEFPAMGLVKRGGHWMINVSQFVVWAQGQASIMKKRAGVPAVAGGLLV